MYKMLRVPTFGEFVQPAARRGTVKRKEKCSAYKISD